MTHSYCPAPRENPFPPSPRRGKMRGMENQDPSMFDKVLSGISGTAILIAFSALVQPFPKLAGYIALGVLVAVYCVQLGRDFVKGVTDAGGWSKKPAVNPPIPNPDAPP